MVVESRNIDLKSNRHEFNYAAKLWCWMSLPSERNKRVDAKAFLSSDDLALSDVASSFVCNGEQLTRYCANSAVYWCVRRRHASILSPLTARRFATTFEMRLQWSRLSLSPSPFVGLVATSLVVDLGMVNSANPKSSHCDASDVRSGDILRAELGNSHLTYRFRCALAICAAG